MPTLGISSKKDVKSMLLPELQSYFESIGEKPFRAGQLFRWLHGGAGAFAEMTNLPAALREKLDAECFINMPQLVETQASQQDGTVKYLWRMLDGETVESVVMEYEHGNTVCISTQAGCAMGCAFCASAIGGLTRNLTASEMIDQVLLSRRYSGKRISNIVLMGIGEPLDNFDNVMRFLQLVSHPAGMNIGARHISLSTCGIIENIDKLAEYKRCRSTLRTMRREPNLCQLTAHTALTGYLRHATGISKKPAGVYHMSTP
jgi:23S rRNA (adenine2503-C2)-methyltransferase